MDSFISWFSGNLTEIVSCCSVGICSLITLVFELLNKRILKKIHENCISKNELDKYYIIVDNQKVYFSDFVGSCEIYKDEN